MSSKFVSRKFLAAAIALGVSCQAFAQEPLPSSKESVERPVSVANVADRPLAKLYLNQWVQARASGELVGNVVRLNGESYGPASGHRVYLMQNGNIVSEGETQSQGQIVFPNVEPGLYTLVARGTNSIGSFSINVLDLNAGKHLPAQFSLPVAEISDSYIDSILTSQAVPSRGPVITPNTNADPLGRSRETADGTFKVALESDSSLQGYLSRPGLAPAQSGLSGTNVVIYENGREIKRTQADANGHYQFDNMKPGCYGLIASGTPGFFASVGFCATAPKAELSQLNSGSVRFVATAAQEAGSGLQVEGGDQPSSATGGSNWELVPNNDDRAGFVPFGGGGPMGGYGGGGGAGGGLFGGGGGLGGLAVLGALGGVAAAIASDDNNNDNPVIVSPIAQP